jgi:RND superfamily putative drug exporter
VGRIISSAAILLTITLLSFANGLSFMKMFGIGTALAVVIDATVIRGVVVPAFLRVAGDLNWWAPRPLKRLHARIGFSEAPVAAAIPAPMPQAAEPETVRFLRPAVAVRQVEVISGWHLVANVSGTVIVVAHRDAAPLSPKSVAVQQLATLADIVRRTDGRRLAGALSQLTMGYRASVDFGIVKPTAAGLDVYLYGAVKVDLDNGMGRTLLHGAPRGLHRSVPAPAVAAVVTVDEAGERPRARQHRTGVYALAAGTVPGQGAVIWSTAAPTRTREEPPTVAIPRPLEYIVLEDNSRFEIDRDCVIGRDPRGSDAVQRGLRPVRLQDGTGRMSRAHVEIRRLNGDVYVVDLSSTNGVFMRQPGLQAWTRLAPWEPVRWVAGASVRIGSRTLRLEAPATQPRQRTNPAIRPTGATRRAREVPQWIHIRRATDCRTGGHVHISAASLLALRQRRREAWADPHAARPLRQRVGASP